jgi:hypothetical protein
VPTGAQRCQRGGPPAALPSATLAQDSTPSASPVTLSGLLLRQIAAIVAGDGEAVAALCTEDGSFDDVSSGAVAHGRGAIAAFFATQAARQTDVTMLPTTAHEG